MLGVGDGASATAFTTTLEIVGPALPDGSYAGVVVAAALTEARDVVPHVVGGSAMTMHG